MHMTAEWRNKMLNKLLKSVLEQDKAPVVVCDIDDIIVYMNPSAITRYHKDLTGRSIKDCHPPKANEMIEKVVAWFRESKDNNIIYTYRNDEENKDVYMVEGEVFNIKITFPYDLKVAHILLKGKDSDD